MSARHVFGATALVLLAAAVTPHPARATTFQWDGGLSHATTADANWTTANNWVGGTAPPQYNAANDTDVVFLGTTARTTSNNNYMLGTVGSTGAEIRTLTFGAGNTAYTLAGNPFFIGTGGIVQNSTATQTFTAAVQAGATETWTFGSGAGGLTLAGGLSVASGGALTISSPGVNFSGSTALTVGSYNGYTSSQTAAGSFTLTNGVTLAPPSLQIGSGAPGTFTQDSGTLNTGVIAVGFLSPGTFHLSGTGQVSATSLVIGDQFASNSTFQQDGGSVNLNGGALSVGTTFYSGTYTLTAGSITAGIVNVGGTTAANFNQTGGTATFSALGVGDDGHTMSALSTYTMSGGQLMTGSLMLGSTAPGAFVQTAGSVIVSGAVTVGGEEASNYNLSGASSSLTAANLYVGTVENGATFTVNSGNVNISAGGSLVVGQGGLGSRSGTFTQNGGTVTVAQGGAVQIIGANTTGTYNLNGGTLSVGKVIGSGSASTLNFNGGTLQANASSTTFVTGLTQAYVQAGGVQIDSNGQNITISQVLLHDPALSAKGSDGGLVKMGAGTLILSAANTYNGGTLIAGGMLEAALNGALGTGNVLLGASAFMLTLDAGVTDAIANNALVSLDSTVGGKIRLLGAAGSVQEIVGFLDFDGVRQTPGTYGATGSGAQFIDDTHFSGTGILAVGVVPEPGTVVFAVAGILLVAVAWGRRRKNSKKFRPLAC